MRVARTITIAVILTLAAAPVRLAAAPVTQSIAHPLDSSTSVSDYVQLAAFRSLEAFGAPEGYIDAIQAPSSARESTGYFMSKAPDFDGDRKDDLLGFRPEEPSRGEDGPGGGTVVGISGTDGRVLWTFEEADVYLWASPLKLGPKAESGVLVLAFRWDWRDTPVVAIESAETRLIALDSDGREIWRRSFQGTTAYSMALQVARDISYPSGTFDAVGNKATDILVGTRDVFATPLSWRTSLDAVVVDGADGELYNVGREEEDQSELMLTTAPDLDEDDRDDVIFLGWSEERGSWMTARSSQDGREIWTNDDRGLNAFSYPRRAGDVDGDGTDDLLLSGGCECVVVELDSDATRSARALSSPGGYRGRTGTSLLDGASGQLSWQRRLGSARPVADIDGDGNPDIAGQDFAWTRSEISISYAAVNGAGEPLYRRTYRMGSAEDSAGNVDTYANAGDVDLDGITDSVHDLTFADLEEEEFTTDRGLISGRTGTKRWESAPGRPLRETLDGSGDDLVDVDVDGGRFRLTAQDGRSGLPLWKVAVNRPRGDRMVFGTDLTGDGLAEVVVTFLRWDRRMQATTIVFDGLDGSVLWRR